MALSFDQSLSGKYLLLPGFDHCVPAMANPESDRAVEDSHKWCKDGLAALLPACDLNTLLAERASMWTSLVLPTAPYDFLVAAARYTEYLSILDNALVDKERLGCDPVYASEMKTAIDSVFWPGSDSTPVSNQLATWFEPLRDCLTTLRMYLSDAVWLRLYKEVARFLVGCVEEVSYRNSDTVYSFDEYLRMRRDSVGMGMYFALGEALVPQLQERKAEAAAVLASLVDDALDHIALANDLFSFRAEADANDTVNAVATLVLGQQLTVQAAIDGVALEVAQRETDFRRHLEHATDSLGANHPVSQYGVLLWHMMCGNVDWSYRTTRYNGEGHQWNGEYPKVVQFQKGSTVFTNLSYADLVNRRLI